QAQLPGEHKIKMTPARLAFADSQQKRLQVVLHCMEFLDNAPPLYRKEVQVAIGKLITEFPDVGKTRMMREAHTALTAEGAEYAADYAALARRLVSLGIYMQREATGDPVAPVTQKQTDAFAQRREILEAVVAALREKRVKAGE